jgi:hypothetical protein
MSPAPTTSRWRSTAIQAISRRGRRAAPTTTLAEQRSALQAMVDAAPRPTDSRSRVTKRVATVTVLLESQRSFHSRR